MLMEVKVAQKPGKAALDPLYDRHQKSINQETYQRKIETLQKKSDHLRNSTMDFAQDRKP